MRKEAALLLFLIVSFVSGGVAEHGYEAAAPSSELAGALGPVSHHPILLQNCAECHNDKKQKGDFNLRVLGNGPTQDNIKYWLSALDMVKYGEMPPEDISELSRRERVQLISDLQEKLNLFENVTMVVGDTSLRRLNNREFEKSLRDALLLEDLGTHQPTDNLIGDAYFQGFDTHAETLGFSRYHLEQYIEATRKIVDAVIYSGRRPQASRYEIGPGALLRTGKREGSNFFEKQEKRGYAELREAKPSIYFKGFESVPASGRYRIKIRAEGKDRNVYDASYTGFYEADPIRLSVHMGNRVKTFNLPDEEQTVIEMDEWLDAGTQVELRYPTDAFALRGNGNFKFQLGIVKDYLRKHNRTLLQKKREKNGTLGPTLLAKLWQGARPLIYEVHIDGPFYESWPPKRQVGLIGENPKVRDCAEILEPIAERAWRRPVRAGELDPIVQLVKSHQRSRGDIEAIKEGIVAIFVSPSFLFVNVDDGLVAERFATKLSYFLQGSSPALSLRSLAVNGGLDSYESVLSVTHRLLESSRGEDFLREFPYGWLELADINFMAPDEEKYRFYHRKRLSEDMVDEALHFFRHIVENNLAIPELITADYSFINKDLALLYGVEEFPEQSEFQKYTFTDGRRGGLLGMGAFLTSTADNMSTSPIHRAVYVMENFMGIHPAPPPADLEIPEPDVRQAKTIKEILAAHQSEESCASCHKSIDPWGFAFENFDPTGAWREDYGDDRDRIMIDGAFTPKARKGKSRPGPRVDPSAKFRNGEAYQDIRAYRKIISSPSMQKRFVRCFITKLLIYANGAEPDATDFAELDSLVALSESREYRIVDTIAAVIDSPLFRGEIHNEITVATDQSTPFH